MRKVKKEKEVLYVFLHLPKTGGTTIAQHIHKNMDSEEIYSSYEDREVDHSFPVKKHVCEKINQLKNKGKIKVILGHTVGYWLHELFPEKEVRYITFFRNPADFLISLYNFRVRLLNRKFGRMMKHNKINLRDFMLDEFDKIIPFEEYTKLVQNHCASFLEKSVLKGQWFTLEDEFKQTYDLEEIKKVKEMMSKFYFIGLTENAEDYYFVYHLLGINKFVLNRNRSKHYYYYPKDYKGYKKRILELNKDDEELYQFAGKLNEQFKKNHKEFSKIVLKIKRKRVCYMPVIFIKGISLKLRQKSELFSRFLKRCCKQAIRRFSQKPNNR